MFDGGSIPVPPLPFCPVRFLSRSTPDSTVLIPLSVGFIFLITLLVSFRAGKRRPFTLISTRPNHSPYPLTSLPFSSFRGLSGFFSYNSRDRFDHPLGTPRKPCLTPTSILPGDPSEVLLSNHSMFPPFSF